MGIAPTTAQSAGGGLVNVAQLLSTLAPLFLGSGNQTTTTGPQSSTSTSKSSLDASTLAMLTNIISTAGNNAANPTATKGVVDRIMQDSSAAFAPVIAGQSSAGLYNTSTLAGLAGDAKARATAAASKAVLDYQTSQQSIQLNALNTVAQGNKSTTTSTSVSPTSSIKIQAPPINPISTIATIGGGVLANKLLASGPVSNALDVAGSSINAHLIAPVTDALGITSNAAPIAAQSSLLNGSGGSFATGIGSVGGATIAPGLSAEGIAGLAAPATSTIAGFGADTAALAAEQGGELLTFATAGELGGAAVSGGVAGGALAGGAELGSGIGAGADFLAGGELLGEGGAALGGAALGAGAAELGGLAGAGIADLGGEIALSGFGELVGAEAGFDFGAALLDAAIAIVSWIVCTELLRQGKMSPTLYRYGQKKFISYPEYGKYGYLLWARPVRSYIRRNPDTKLTAFVASFFNLRVNNIAYRMGCSRAKWTYRGACICGFTYIVSIGLGALLVPIRGNLLKNYFAVARAGV